MQNLDLFNELAEHIILRFNSINIGYHDMYWFERKAHMDYDIWIIISGSVIIETGGVKHTAGEGDTVFFYPDITYTAKALGKECKFIYFHFDFGIGENFKVLNSLRLSGIIPRGLADNEKGMVQAAFEKYRLKQEMSAMSLKGCFLVFLARIIELGSNGRYIGNFPEEGQSRIAKKLSALEPIFIYINKNLYRPIAICELSAEINMSEKYFITYFKNALGVTPGQYINQFKMNRAREFIYQNLYSLKEIANLLGYNDQYAFSKAFKKYYNVPPSRFK